MDLLLVLMVAHPAAAQQVGVAVSPRAEVEQIDSGAVNRLQQIEQLFAQDQIQRAVDELRAVADEQPERLVPVEAAGILSAAVAPARPEEEAAFLRYVPLRQFAHDRLSRSDLATRFALEAYRRQVDPVAAGRLQAARQNDFDWAALEQIVDQMLPSTAGIEAADLLAQQALREGDFTAARRYWGRLYPEFVSFYSKFAAGRDLPGSQSFEIQVAPLAVDEPRSWFRSETRPAPADVAARLTLVSILEGNRRRAEIELAAFTKLYPQAEGPLAGRTQNYAAALASLLQSSADWPELPPRRGWPTFAGDPERSAPALAPKDPPLRVAWSLPLEDVTAVDPQTERHFGYPPNRAGEDYRHMLGRYPAVAGGMVFIGSENRVRAIDLYTGRPAWPLDAETTDDVVFRLQTPVDRDVESAAWLGAARWTATVEGNYLLARLGSAATGYPMGEETAYTPGCLVGLDLRAQGRVLKGDYPIRPESTRWTFEGTPLCDGELLFVGMRYADVRPHAYAAAYEVRTGRLVWRRRICSAETLSHGRTMEMSHNLLTLAGDTLYYNTNLGGVAALEKSTGRVRWITTYPRRGSTRESLREEPWHLLRDLTPCLYRDGVLYVAPSDSPGLFALDAATGRLLWQTDVSPGQLDVTYLLGVYDGRLIAGGRRLWWLDADSGRPSRLEADNPFPLAPGAQPRGFGRGLLTDDGRILWPTRGESDLVFVLDARTGRQLRQPIDLTAAGAEAGNLTAAEGYLIITSSNRIYALEGEPSD